jgi:acyl-CoA synthetase (AMP-forming)/AMP-acid ligase II/acyl carrier protein
LEHQARRIPDRPAILAPGRAPLTYRHLYQHIDTMGRTLRALGIGRHDRIAVVLPNGPETAVAILTVAASAACAPMNPAYGIDEFERYFAALRPRALITQAGIVSSARRAAVSRGMPVIELSTASDAAAGVFTLSAGQGRAASDEAVMAGDAALLLLTSGTTSLPKIVPLTHANLCASAYCSVAAVALTEKDRCLNMMPLFHGHGLTNILLASLAAGAGVVCTPGCDVNRFFAWLTAFRPTWYSAVPTMHQALLVQARNNHERAAHHRLRFVRSASASLRPHTCTDLERTFEAPVIEAYGMTETASLPIASNPLPPRQRKPGSVGIPVSLDVAIMDERGALLSDGQTGQIVVRGESVIAGYDGDPAATDAAFAADWFKTGDLGFFDDDGYLFLTGRIREMVNRGGEKIAPQEVDEVLLQHPAVAEAVTFAVPHPTLGEDVGSAVVLRPDAAATPKDIHQFAMGRIAAFKVPHQVLIVAEIPKGPTGKVQRVGLAAKLGLATKTALPQAPISPRTPLEKTLAGIWAEVLQVEQVGLHDDFFALGGDSLLATRVLVRLHEITHAEIEVSLIFEAPTVAEMAERIETLMKAAAASQAPSAIARVPRENGAAPAAFVQERLWELQHALPDLPFFNVLYALRVTSPCDAAVLERSINEIVRRHEILRTTFAAVDGRCAQVIAPQLIAPLAFDDLRALSRMQMETTVHELIKEELSHLFVLERGPLIRTHLVRLAERTHLLIIGLAGAIEDGWSLGVLVKELAALYDAFAAGRASPLRPLPIQYADFAGWQRRWQSYPDIVAQLTYWEEQLREPLPVMKLTRSRRRRKIDDLSTARRQVALPAKLSETAKEFSQREGVTLFMTLVAAFKTLLHRYSGEHDLRVATDVANRNRPQTEGLIGPIANTVILRTSLRGDPSAREVIRRVRATTLKALANQDIPFEAVVEALERDRAIEPAALAQVKMSLQSDSLRPAAGSDHGLDFEEVDPGMPQPLVTMTTFDVIVMLRDSGKGLGGSCVYKPHLFGAEAIDHLLRDFQRVLEYMVMQPERPISAIAVSPN